ncbi:hypothetical protein GQ600_26166 [Phytophthora cactorum]|nr:hypothetical protein GQ600_26166 [Phytophthora cactorum]
MRTSEPFKLYQSADKATPMTDKAVGAVGSPTSAASFAAPAIRDSSPQVSSEAVDVSTTPTAASSQQQTPKSASGSGSRKRVFTFQKRWLHSLPIVERSLPEAEMDGRVLKAVRTAGGASAAAAVTAAAAAGADKQKDVVVCMLCDDPASKRELTKVWSRLNCRRGRIENHLMSKHPEFMRLLKYKREAEGDLAVQIFLQNLREGRCNARTEINNGLYSQLTIGTGARSSPIAADTTADNAELQKRALGDYMNVRELREELEGARKRAKLSSSPAGAKDAAALAASEYCAGGMAMRTNGALAHGADAGVDGLAPSVLPRGVMLPVLGSFRTQKSIAEWCGSIATKYQRVDFLINYAGSEVVEALTLGEKQPRGSSEDVDKVASSTALIEALSESMTSTCFPDPAVSEDGWLTSSTGTIVNIASAVDDATVEPLVKSLAAKLQPRNRRQRQRVWIELVSMNSSTRVAGTAAIFLRPLRYMFDVETDVQVETEEDSTALLPFDTVHVHLRAATRPPLMERDELLNGFLRAETLIHTTCSPSNGSRNVAKYNLDLQDSKEEYLEDESDGGERTLSSLRGTYIWVLVRLQPLDRNTSKFILSDAKHTETLRVQYQLSPSSESFCLPVDHTNVDAKMLQFTFLSVSLSTAETPETKNVEAKASAPTTTSFNYSDAALAASEAAAAEEIRRRQRVEAELAEAKSAAQAKDRERLDAQIQAKQDAQRAQELELARNEQVYARSLLEQELAVREQQNQELKQVRKQLEDQLQATSESAQHFQVNINSTDQALEVFFL